MAHKHSIILPRPPPPPSSSSAAVLSYHRTTRPQLDSNKISTALSLTLQFPTRSNWAHLERAWITDHLTKKMSEYDLKKKVEIKGIKSWGERGHSKRLSKHATTSHAELTLSMSHTEISGTDCSFSARMKKVFKHVWAVTCCPLQLNRSPAHYSGSPSLHCHHQLLVSPAACWIRTHSNMLSRCEKPACGPVCCWNNTLHINTWPREGEEKTLADHVSVFPKEWQWKWGREGWDFSVFQRFFIHLKRFIVNLVVVVI